MSSRAWRSSATKVEPRGRARRPAAASAVAPVGRTTKAPCLLAPHSTIAPGSTSSATESFLDDDVDELVGHDDHAPLLALQVRLHLLGGAGAGDQLLLGEPGRHL